MRWYDSKLFGSVIIALIFILISTTTVSAEVNAVLYDGDGRSITDAPDVVAYANIEYTAPPPEFQISTSGYIWRYHQFIALMNSGNWVEAKTTVETDTVGVQFNGDTNDGWARVLVDGTEVWTGSVYGSDVNYPGGAFVKYLKVSGLDSSTHTIRVENMGVKGAGGGIHVCIRFFGLETNEEEYSIEPSTNEITVGDSIKFSLIKKINGKDTTVSNNEVDWVVTNEKSINPNIVSSKANIGTIDDGTGEFKSSNIGTCTIVARVNGETKAKAEVTVVCCKDCEGDINKVIKLYNSRIPEGQVWKDGSTPAAILNNPPAAGYYNNMMSLGSAKYEPYVCQAYQDKVMNFLYAIQSNPDECSLLEGYEFIRITGWGGAHLAVVVYEKGTDWEKTGLVFDPWLSQKPDVYLIDQWKFYGRTSDKSMIDSVGDAANWIIGLVWCPVDILIIDDQGRRLGVLDDGSMVAEIPNSYAINFQDENGEMHWYFELTSDDLDTYTMQVTGNDDGKFGTAWSDSNSGTVRNYVDQTIIKGSTAEILLDPEDPVAPLVLPDGNQIEPLISGEVQQSSGLTFESRSKSSGSSVQIPLTLAGIDENIGNMDITLDYDPSVLEATEVIKGGLTTDSLFDHNILDGTIKISLADKEGFSGDGSIAYVRFDVVGAEGSSSPLDITSIAANKADDLSAIDIPDRDGVFKVVSKEESQGDADGDETYTALDALYALQMAVGKIPEDMTMDMNSDGQVSSIDARKILRIAAGLEYLT